MTTPNLMLPEVPQAIRNASEPLNRGLLTVDALLQSAVVSHTQTVPPINPVQGQRWIIPQDAIGAWQNRTNHIAYRGPEGWIFLVPRPGWLVWSLEDETFYVYKSSGWEPLSAGSGSDSDLIDWNKLWITDGPSTTLARVGCASPGTNGTPSLPSKNVPGSGVYEYMNRLRLTSGTSAGSSGFLNSSHVQDTFYARATAAAAAGFELYMRFGTSTILADEKFFAGAANNSNFNSALSAEPSTCLNVLGIGKDTTDTTYNFFYNDGSGTCTKVDTGLTFAAGKTFDLWIRVPRGGGSASLLLKDLDTDTEYEETTSTNIPGVDVSLNWKLRGALGPTTGTACSVELAWVKLRYPL